MMGFGAGAMYGVGGWLTLLGCVALFIGLVLVAAWALNRAPAASRDPGARALPPTGAPDALETLRLRFARGEISAAEFTEARKTLGADR